MAKKYYAIFWLNDDPNMYAMMFKIEGSLVYDRAHKCFEDKDWYVRSIDDVVCYAALDAHPINSRKYGGAFLVDHNTFVLYRSRGCKKYEPKRKVIFWD